MPDDITPEEARRRHLQRCRKLPRSGPAMFIEPEFIEDADGNPLGVTVTRTPVFFYNPIDDIDDPDEDATPPAA